MPIDLQPVWDCIEAGTFLRLHRKTVKRMARLGDLPAMRIGNRWRFRPDQLDNWLRTQVPSSNSLRRKMRREETFAAKRKSTWLARETGKKRRALGLGVAISSKRSGRLPQESVRAARSGRRDSDRASGMKKAIDPSHR
jgi:excisionase family DNA binding protein